MRQKQYYIYILANKSNSVLYTGVTNSLRDRICQHKEKVVAGFTSRYNVDKLVYFEEFDNSYDAISREKQIKNWHRQWKIDLIESVNSHWEDLSKNF